jgi:hypothetical protein
MFVFCNATTRASNSRKRSVAVMNHQPNVLQGDEVKAKVWVFGRPWLLHGNSLKSHRAWPVLLMV